MNQKKLSRMKPKNKEINKMKEEYSDLLKDKKTKIKLHIIKINDELNGLKVKIKNRESLQKLINKKNESFVYCFEPT